MSFQQPASSGHPPSKMSSRLSQRCPSRRRRRVLALALLPLLVMPTFAAAAAAAAPAAADAAIGAAAGAGARAGSTVVAPEADAAAGVGSKSKFDVGTKDAPVDGKDGRPHEGPFVEIENLRKNGDGADDTAQKNTVYIDGKKVPESNDGVMDDKNRMAPKEGTTGTSGGVSEKDKQRKAKEGQTGERVENTPDSPKAAPPLPHHEQEKISGSDPAKDTGDKAKDAGEDVSGLEKPLDLPEKTHDGTIPVPGSAQKGHLDIAAPSTDKSRTPAVPAGSKETPATLIQPFHSFVLSLTMILVSEVGDKTFLVAALMAMKHDRAVVFTAAFSALFTMTVLSAVLGHAVPTLIPKRLTNFMAAGLFLIFGARMLREGMGMDANEGVGAEMQEVELELAEKEHQARENGRLRRGDGGVLSPDTLEMGVGGGRSASRFSTPNRSTSSSLSPPRGGRAGWRSAGANEGALGTLRGLGHGMGNLASLLLSPAWVQTFVMTFLGEWGDRSQIATIAMAAGQDYWWVTLGAVVGHACCTGVAVLGGRAIAGRVSLKVVTLGGAISFLVFGIIYLFEGFYYA